MNRERPLIVMLTPNQDTFSNPSLVSFIHQSKDKVEIALIAPPQHYEFSFSHLNHFVVFPRVTTSWITNIKCFIKIIVIFWKINPKRKSTTIIGIDPEGYIWASLFKIILGFKKLAYWSFEIFPKEECEQKNFKLINYYETFFIKKCNLLVIQDEERLELFKNNFTFNGEILLIPVSLSADLENINTINVRDTYNIPSSAKIVIFSGSLQQWTGIFQILQILFQHLPDDIYILLHSRYKNANDESLFNLNEVYRHRVIVTNTPFDNILELSDFVNQCDIGIVSYSPNKENNPYLGKNISVIGLASGKFSLYARAGLAILTSNSSIYKNLNSKYNFGKVFENVEEIPDLIVSIMENLEEHKKNSILLYNSKLKPDYRIKKLLSLLSES